MPWLTHPEVKRDWLNSPHDAGHKVCWSACIVHCISFIYTYDFGLPALWSELNAGDCS